MRYFSYIIKSAVRNRMRFLLMVLSGGFSVFLLLALQVFLGHLLDPPHAAVADLRIAVSPTTSFLDSLPITVMQRIARTEHVKHVTPFQFFPSQIGRNMKDQFSALGVDPVKFWEVFPDIQVAAGVREAFTKNRIGAVVGHELMKAYGWKVGQRLILTGIYLPIDMEFEIIGEYDWTFRSNVLFFNFDYYNESTDQPGRSSMYWLVTDHPDHVAGVKDAIEADMRNSGSPVKVETDRAFFLNVLSTLGNIQALMAAIGAVVTFTMLLVSGSNMGMIVRERSLEIGILKAMGFQWQRILAMILGEAACMGAISGAVAMALTASMQLVPFQKITMGLISGFHPRPEQIAITLAVGLLLGVVAAAPSSVKAARMNIIQALKRMD